MTSEANFDPKYLETEQSYRQRVLPIHDRERRVREAIRSDISLTDEERMDKYIAAYRELEQEFEKHANEHGRAFSEDLTALDKKLNAGTGEQFAQHLTAAASVPDEKLEQLMSTAQRTGQKDLARAVAQTALERNQHGVFQRWADSDPETAEALKRRRSLPPYDRFLTRTMALKPMKADLTSLTPSEEDRRRATEQSQGAKSKEYQEFFGRSVGQLPRRQVGGRRVS